MASETPKSQRQARNTLSQDIDGVVDDFISKLNVIAERHARCFFFFFFSRCVDG
jgi:hypothetical protein